MEGMAFIRNWVEEVRELASKWNFEGKSRSAGDALEFQAEYLGSLLDLVWEEVQEEDSVLSRELSSYMSEMTIWISKVHARRYSDEKEVMVPLKSPEEIRHGVPPLDDSVVHFDGLTNQPQEHSTAPDVCSPINPQESMDSRSIGSTIISDISIAEDEECQENSQNRFVFQGDLDKPEMGDTLVLLKLKGDQELLNTMMDDCKENSIQFFPAHHAPHLFDKMPSRMIAFFDVLVDQEPTLCSDLKFFAISIPYDRGKVRDTGVFGNEFDFKLESGMVEFDSSPLEWFCYSVGTKLRIDLLLSIDHSSWVFDPGGVSSLVTNTIRSIVRFSSTMAVIADENGVFDPGVSLIDCSSPTWLIFGVFTINDRIVFSCCLREAAYFPFLLILNIGWTCSWRFSTCCVLLIFGQVLLLFCAEFCVMSVAMVTVLKNFTNVITTAVGEMYLFSKYHDSRVWTAMFFDDHFSNIGRRHRYIVQCCLPIAS